MQLNIIPRKMIENLFTKRVKVARRENETLNFLMRKILVDFLLSSQKCLQESAKAFPCAGLVLFNLTWKSSLTPSNPLKAFAPPGRNLSPNGKFNHCQGIFNIFYFLPNEPLSKAQRAFAIVVPRHFIGIFSR